MGCGAMSGVDPSAAAAAGGGCGAGGGGCGGGTSPLAATATSAIADAMNEPQKAFSRASDNAIAPTNLLTRETA